MTAATPYPPGYSAEEARRLESQGDLIRDISREMFRRGGLREGMRVLDVGCGVGDVSLLAAEVVGPSGFVVGVDRHRSSLDWARNRAARRGAANVEFLLADLTDFEPSGAFDAVIGRLVLMYLADPVSALRRLIRGVKPGGLVIFQEADWSAASQAPASEVFERALGWICRAFTAGGAQTDMGGKLLTTFLAAGLQRPGMVGYTAIESGADSAYFDFLAQIVRTLAPVLEGAGLAKREDLGLETLAERLREDAVAQELALYAPRLVCAWARVPTV